MAVSIGHAQITVGPGGATNDFAMQPTASQLATRALSGAAGDITTAVALDARVQTNLAAFINAPLVSSAGNPPAATGIAVWSPSGFVQTRPAGNAAILLMMTLQNDAGGESGELNISYDFTGLLPTSEQVPGHRVYFSLTGEANTWQLLPTLSGDTSGRKSATINLGSWATGALLYLLWADDNGAGSPDAAYQLDNFSAVFFTGPPRVLASPQSQSIGPGSSATLSVFAAGATPLFYQWRKNSNDLAGATNSTFNISNAQASDAGQYSVLVSNAFGLATSSVAVVSFEVQPLTIGDQPQDTTIVVGNSAILVASVNGTAPAFQWFKGSNAVAGATGSTLTISAAQLEDTGLYHVLATNMLNSVTSRSAIVNVVPPPYPLLGLTNHLWHYNQAGVDFGTAWREVDYPAETNWLTGRGVLAQEDNNSFVRSLTNTVLSLTNSSGARVITYYFRTPIVLTNTPGDVMLVTSNLIDDGAVVYVNGNEAYRMSMPAGPISYTTLAGTPPAEGVFATNVVPGHCLRTGTNVLAVEVHQNSTGSQDVVMGLGAFVHYAGATLLGIANQPQSVAVDELRPASFTIGFTGLSARVHWFRQTAGGAEAVPGANAATFTIPQPLQGTHDGTYFALISNAVDVVVSAAATPH